VHSTEFYCVNPGMGLRFFVASKDITGYIKRVFRIYKLFKN